MRNELRNRIKEWSANLLKPMLTVLILLGGSQFTFAQFVDIRIELPASGNQVKTMDIQSDSNNSHRLQWLGISLSENIELTVEINYLNLPAGESQMRSFFLNDGTVKTENALPFTNNHSTFVVSNQGRLINQLPGPPRKLTAWIGFPFWQIRELTVIYN